MTDPTTIAPTIGLQSFAECLVVVRKAAGAGSLGKFARALGITKRDYAALEAAERHPSIDELIAISRVANVTLDFLVGGDLPKPGFLDGPAAASHPPTLH